MHVKHQGIKYSVCFSHVDFPTAGRRQARQGGVEVATLRAQRPGIDRRVSQAIAAQPSPTTSTLKNMLETVKYLSRGVSGLPGPLARST